VFAILPIGIRGSRGRLRRPRQQASGGGGSGTAISVSGRSTTRSRVAGNAAGGVSFTNINSAAQRHHHRRTGRLGIPVPLDRRPRWAGRAELTIGVARTRTGTPPVNTFASCSAPRCRSDSSTNGRSMHRTAPATGAVSSFRFIHMAQPPCPPQLAPQELRAARSGEALQVLDVRASEKSRRARVGWARDSNSGHAELQTVRALVAHRAATRPQSARRRDRNRGNSSKQSTAFLRSGIRGLLGHREGGVGEGLVARRSRDAFARGTSWQLDRLGGRDELRAVSDGDAVVVDPGGTWPVRRAPGELSATPAAVVDTHCTPTI